MTDIAGNDIDHLAKLSRLELSQEEKEKFGSQLPKIIEFVEELQGADTEEVNADPVVSLGSLREDKITNNGLSLEQLEKLAPRFEADKVVVPPVFGESNDV
jgi:aspartyl-tRNA(Asn)/glutamyl-tRNA(Gln) amidotransferase subunit C